jgi:hypothetical protein
MRWPWSTPAALTPAEVVARRRKRRRLRLSWLGVAALAWVSYGSYELVVWAMNITSDLGRWSAVAYPLIVDLGVIFVMPYSTDAALPSHKGENVRRHARVTVNITFMAILAFNAAHALIVANRAAETWAGGKPWAAIIAGAVPVFLYIRAGQLTTMVESWEANERAREAQEAEARAAARAEEQEEQRENTAAEVALAEAEARRLAAQAAADKAAADLKRVNEAREVTRTAPSVSRAGGRPGKGLTPEQVALLESLPGETKKEKTIAYLRQQHAAGNPINGTQAAHALGTDPKTTRDIYKELERAGELRPKLTVANR